MIKVTSKEFQRNFGEYQQKALKETVIITHYGRDRLVLLDAAEYANLRKRARIALSTSKLSKEDIQLISKSEMSPEHNHLN